MSRSGSLGAIPEGAAGPRRRRTVVFGGVGVLIGSGGGGAADALAAAPFADRLAEAPDLATCWRSGMMDGPDYAFKGWPFSGIPERLPKRRDRRDREQLCGRSCKIPAEQKSASSSELTPEIRTNRFKGSLRFFTVCRDKSRAAGATLVQSLRYFDDRSKPGDGAGSNAVRDGLRQF